MNYNQLAEWSKDKIGECLPESHFNFEPGSLLTEEDGEIVSIEADIAFNFGNINIRHSVVIGWNDVDGPGFEHGEDGDVTEITRLSCFQAMYYSMAMKDLDDEYLI